MGKGNSKFKLPGWAKSIGVWAFTAITGAGFTVYMDTDRNKQAIVYMQKTDDRQDVDIAQLQADARANDEKTKKSVEKLDQILAMLERRMK